MAIYKVSYVIPKDPLASTILIQEHPPQVGDTLTLHNQTYRVVEVITLMPPQGPIHFLHATIEPVTPNTP